VNETKRTVRVDMNALEEAFEEPVDMVAHFLDTETGQCVEIPLDFDDSELAHEAQEYLERIQAIPDRYIELPTDDDFRPSVTEAQRFTAQLENKALRQRLNTALEGPRGPMRRFARVLRDDPAEAKRWDYVRRQRLRQNITAYLASAGVTALYDALPPYDAGAAPPRKKS
jgi:hypothetical protein